MENSNTETTVLCRLCTNSIGDGEPFLKLGSEGLWYHIECLKSARAIEVIEHFTDEACLNGDWQTRVRKPSQLLHRVVPDFG